MNIKDFMKEMDDKKQKLANNNVEIRFKKFDKNLPALHKETENNVGFDLFARLEKPVKLKPGEVTKIPLNVATEIPLGMVGLVFQRSSTFKKWGIRITNNVGVIDPSYRGDGDEWMAEVQNMTDRQVTINPGDKICQAVFLSVPSVILREVNNLGYKDRGGFGTSFDNAEVLQGGEEK